MTPTRLKLLSQFSGLAMLLFGAVAAMGWLSKVMVFGDVTATQIAAGLGVLCGVVSRWAAGQLPPAKAKLPPAAPAVLLMVVLGVTLALTLPACKVPPLATAYRAHSLLVTARDGVGETLAKVQRAKMLKCEAEHKPPAEGWKVALRGCYVDVRAPVLIWVQHIRPSLTAAAAAFWLALESVFIAGDKSLDKAGKAAAVACAGLQAADATLKQYADKLGDLKATILGAVAAGKVLMCK